MEGQIAIKDIHGKRHLVCLDKVSSVDLDAMLPNDDTGRPCIEIVMVTQKRTSTGGTDAMRFFVADRQAKALRRFFCEQVEDDLDFSEIDEPREVDTADDDIF